MIFHCHVPMPPAGEVDVTQALTTRAKSPMNMYMHKISRNRMLKENTLQYDMHKRNCLSYTSIIIHLA